MARMKNFLTIILGLTTSMTILANECAFLEGPVNKLPPGFSSPDTFICETLTDKKVNQGKPLNIHQLKQAHEKITKPHQKNTIWGQLQLATANRKVDCMIATGNFKTCHCLGSQLPWWLSYSGYLSIVTSSKEISAEAFQLSQSEFSKLSGIVWSVRDTCITGSK
jgi:hypothetical protein